jgi:hypothetical protein
LGEPCRRAGRRPTKRNNAADPDGHGRLELTKFHNPTALSAEPKNAPVNTLGIRRIMFAVEPLGETTADDTARVALASARAGALDGLRG